MKIRTRHVRPTKPINAHQAKAALRKIRMRTIARKGIAPPPIEDTLQGSETGLRDKTYDRMPSKDSFIVNKLTGGSINNGATATDELPLLTRNPTRSVAETSVLSALYGSPLPMYMPQGSQRALEASETYKPGPAHGNILYNFGGQGGTRIETVAGRASLQ